MSLGGRVMCYIAVIALSGLLSAELAPRLLLGGMMHAFPARAGGQEYSRIEQVIAAQAAFHMPIVMPETRVGPVDGETAAEVVQLAIEIDRAETPDRPVVAMAAVPPPQARLETASAAPVAAKPDVGRAKARPAAKAGKPGPRATVVRVAAAAKAKVRLVATVRLARANRQLAAAKPGKRRVEVAIAKVRRPGIVRVAAFTVRRGEATPGEIVRLQLAQRF